MSLIPQLPVGRVWRILRRYKSPWFYWHTGHRRIAVLSLLGSSVVLWGGFVALAGFSIWGVVLALVLDAAGFWLALLYLLLLRTYLPAWTGLRDSADAFIVQQLLAPVLLGFFVTRAVTFLVAKACGYTAPSPSPSPFPSPPPRPPTP